MKLKRLSIQALKAFVKSELTMITEAVEVGLFPTFDFSHLEMMESNPCKIETDGDVLPPFSQVVN